MTPRVQRIQKPSRPGRSVRPGMRSALMRGPSSISTAGSSVMAASTATVTTMIAASAIDCTARTGTIQIEASETITVMPEKATAVPEVAIAVGNGPIGGGTGQQLLAEPGKDEHRVVHGDADADHGHHRGRVDRHLRVRRHQVDERERDQHRERSQRGRHQHRHHGAEQHQQHDQDHRRGQQLGALQALLGDVLEGGVVGGRAQQEGAHRRVGVLYQALQVAGDRERAVLVDRREADERDGAAVGRVLGRCREVDLGVARGHLRAHLGDPCSRGRGGGGVDQERERVGAAAGLVVQVVDRLLRLRAGNVEATGGEHALSLAGERQCGRQQHDPDRHHPPRAARADRCAAQDQALHRVVMVARRSPATGRTGRSGSGTMSEPHGGRSSMAEQEPSKLKTGVRFSSPASSQLLRDRPLGGDQLLQEILQLVEALLLAAGFALDVLVALHVLVTARLVAVRQPDRHRRDPV